MRSLVKGFMKSLTEHQPLLKENRATNVVIFALLIFLMLIKTTKLKTITQKSQRAYTGLIERHSNMPVVGMDTTFAMNLLQ